MLTPVVLDHEDCIEIYSVIDAASYLPGVLLPGCVVEFAACYRSEPSEVFIFQATIESGGELDVSFVLIKDLAKVNDKPVDKTKLSPESVEFVAKNRNKLAVTSILSVSPKK